mgnify:CR=1 FL=1
MKVLLLGEFSALHKNLKEGLEELGHEVTLAASGDGFKKVPVDILLESKLPSKLGVIHKNLLWWNTLRVMKDFDVVQLMNPFLFHAKFFPKKMFFKKIIKKNKKFFILAAGDDAYFWKFGRKSLSYGPFDDFLKYDLKYKEYYMDSEWAFRFNSWLVNRSRGVIPVMYEYEVSYQNEVKRLETIPLPMNLKEIKYVENEYGFKGTRYVEEAFRYLSSKYPNQLELIIKGQMPLKEYLQLMSRTNVVIDQMNSYSLGVNGVYALAMGKVVMGGGEPESLKSLGVNNSPVSN